MFSALRVGEYKFMMASISDGGTDVLNPGGFTGVTQKYPYGRLYNLWLDPKETHSYLIRKLAYIEAFQRGIGGHLMTFRGLSGQDDGRAEHLSARAPSEGPPGGRGSNRPLSGTMGGPPKRPRDAVRTHSGRPPQA